MKEQVYRDKRPLEFFEPFHAHARMRHGGPIYEWTRLVLTPYLLLLHRATCTDSHHVPLTGPAIIAPNHFSFLDHFFVAMPIRRHIAFMAKSQLFTPPLDIWLKGVGAFPVRRGHHDDDAFRTANIVLERGDVVVMYCEGGRSRTGGLGEPKRGVGRLALESGVPVIPTAIIGTAETRNWSRGRFPTVQVRFGAPLTFDRVAEPDRQQSQAASERIFAEVRRLYAEGRQPLRITPRAVAAAGGT